MSWVVRRVDPACLTRPSEHYQALGADDADHLGAAGVPIRVVQEMARQRAGARKGALGVPSEQHERWKHNLLRHLRRKLSGCPWCAMGFDQRHPRAPEGTLICQIPERPLWAPSQMVGWQCPKLDAHMLDILAGAARVVSEKRQAAPRSGYCQPDITILNSSDEPLVFIEVVHTHPPDKSVVVARELGIPVFVIPAPRETLVRPTLGAARPWWEFVPGFLDDEVNREMARAYESYVERVTRPPSMRDGLSARPTWRPLVNRQGL